MFGFPSVDPEYRLNSSALKMDTGPGGPGSLTKNKLSAPTGDRHQDYLNMFTTGSFYDCSFNVMNEITGESKVLKNVYDLIIFSLFAYIHTFCFIKMLCIMHFTRNKNMIIYFAPLHCKIHCFRCSDCTKPSWPLAVKCLRRCFSARSRRHLLIVILKSTFPALHLTCLSWPWGTQFLTSV